MRTSIVSRTLTFILAVAFLHQQANAQATCAAAASLTPLATCSATTGNLQSAANATPAGSCGGATATTTFGVWYKFTATSANTAITISNLGTNLTGVYTPYVEVLSGTCGSFTVLACQNAITNPRVSLTSLTVGTVYYVRVYTTTQGTANPANKWNFDICVQTPPSNDDCSGATTLTSAATCSNTTGTLDLATVSSGIPAGCASSGTHYDVWYKFVATGTNQLVTISSLGANITNPEIQLYSGSCGSLTSLSCGTTAVAASNVTVGNTYYVRVSNVGTDPSGTSGAAFSICVTVPTPAKIDYSKSYINVSKGSTGGTVDPGDTLEMRFTLVVSSKTVDSLSILDTLYNTKGFKLVPGSLALRTNEGKVYKSFTDAFDSDAGWYTTNGLDTVVRINFGTGASNMARGQLSNTSRPSVFNSTCIIMATYRVVVYAPYNTQINFKTGAMTYRDQATTILTKQTFITDNLIVYQSPGLCPNAVSATNALGAEYNGTFGTPGGSGPLARNRGTTPYTSYTYATFNAAAGSPQDYYYGITNNTSGKFTTVNTWAKPDANSYRIFNVWDITGDHTGTNNTTGNPACDTTKPVSPTNPCGYMLVINSAYRADTAFTYTVNNLCPNTYYEISAWFKNICYKCGCDSTGAGVSAAGYIPSAPGDSSGVNPNIAFDVNGVDYYTTGNLKYLGLTTQSNSDSANRWQKRGFVYLTGASETSFTLTLRNNAPGGGGNDWALDDISVATCLPNMQYSPSLSPVTCMNNPITINDTVRSYFNNYKYYKWQLSTDNGTTWSDIAGASGTASPNWNGATWEFITSYTVPNNKTDTTNNGNKYRVVVATTSSNLTNSNCQFTDGVSIINLNVIDCNSSVLDTRLLTFNGRSVSGHAVLNWSTTKINEALHFIVEKSLDGNTYFPIGQVKGIANGGETSQYSFTDSVSLTGKTNYRIILVPVSGAKKYSQTIQLSGKQEELQITNVVNPFKSEINFNITINNNAKVDAILMNASGYAIKQESFMAVNGVNNFSMRNLNLLPAGVYILQIRANGQLFVEKMVKN